MPVLGKLSIYCGILIPVKPRVMNLLNRFLLSEYVTIFVVFSSWIEKNQTSPLYTGQTNLEPQNYRPLSILACLSKIFERVYNDQMGVYFKDVLSTLLSAFRKQHECHHVLTKLMENSKQALDEGKNVGLILLDLSKAFDCLPHRLLLCKLNAYMVFLMKHVVL